MVEQPTDLSQYRRERKIGEVAEDGTTVMGPAPRAGNRRRAKKKGHRVALIDLDVLMRVEMTLAEWRVFTTIARHIPDRGGIEARVTVGEIADLIDMKQPNVSRVIADLVRRDLIIRGERQGVWYVNPHILYNGEFAEWNDILDNYIEPQVSR